MPSLPHGTQSVVLDTSTVVSALLKPGSVPARAVGLAFARCEVCVSDAMEAELVGVLARPKLRRFLDEGAVLGFLSLMRGRARRVVPRERVADCRDAKDNMVLEAALAGGAGVIVSGDADLLVLHPWRGVAVVSAGAFLAGVDVD
ncbi:putative toxin-antitoxin system toxin component, PIN family [Falsiroseomonas ponticola]|uniref:putative toxin-antitoxin system toxin component, PIN family n=1 Tax=Falsiroseomonas ponticola TaxID=2786951 RepID=UPI0019348FC9|nr:putative toxin-antitoxin system toxin component, PIN family [Roseomonas ponticola]